MGAVLLAVLAASCGASGPPSPALSTCTFRIGDSVSRGGAGAVVPPPGHGVIGNYDGASQSGFISIDTSLDRIVTIRSGVTGQPVKTEVCKLP